MNIEMDDNSFWATFVVALCSVAICVCLCVFLYYRTCIKEGYSEKQLEGSLQTMWVKQ